MIKIGVLPFNPFQENTIVVSDETGECIIVDAGNYNAQENAALSKYISDNGLKPVMAVNTHGHGDHMLGVNHVKETYRIMCFGEIYRWIFLLYSRYRTA